MLRSSMAKHSLQGCCSQPNHASWDSSLCLQLLWAQEPQTHFSVSAQRIKQKEMHLSQEVPPRFSAPYRKILVPGTVLYRCPVTLLRGNSTSDWEGIRVKEESGVSMNEVRPVQAHTLTSQGSFCGKWWGRAGVQMQGRGLAQPGRREGHPAQWQPPGVVPM